MTSVTWRIAFCLAFAVVAAVSVAGCGVLKNPTDPNIAFRVVDDKLEVTVCRDIQLAGVSATYRLGGGDWMDFWEGDVAFDLQAGDGFTSANLPANVVISTPPLDPGGELYVYLSSDSDQGIHADVFVPDEGMPTDAWLMSDGTVQDEPCARADELKQRLQ